MLNKNQLAQRLFEDREFRLAIFSLIWLRKHDGSSYSPPDSPPDSPGASLSKEEFWPDHSLVPGFDVEMVTFEKSY